jgi:hypothetical protein
LAGKGNFISPDGVQRIIQLLGSTEMTIAEIAQRMSCSRSAVISINRRFQVREYNGLRTQWLIISASAGRDRTKLHGPADDD